VGGVRSGKKLMLVQGTSRVNAPLFRLPLKGLVGVDVNSVSCVQTVGLVELLKHPLQAEKACLRM